MALTFLYRDLDATDTDVTPYVVLRFNENPQGMAENAEERSVGAWELQIEDDGALDLHAQRTFYVLEDDTYDGDPVLWVGQTFDKHSERGPIHRTGAGRVYTLSLIDLNTVLERRAIHGSHSQNRPAETDVERMLWLESEGLITGGTDWISTANPVDMDAVDYDGRMVAEVIEDCMGQSGKNCFEFRDPDDGGFKTFYGDSSADIDVLTSDIRISNVQTDIDNVTTWEALLDADQWEANSRIYSGIFANYDGGAVYQENATTVANFSHRDTVVSWPDVKTATKANARAIRYLNDIGTQEYRITCAIEVDSDQVGFMPHAGWRLQARFSHFPAFTAFTWMRILSRNTTLIGPNRYRVQYELSPGSPTSPGLSCSAQIAASDLTVTAETNAASSITFTPNAPPATPSVIIIGHWSRNHTGAYGTGPITSGYMTGDVTEVNNTRSDYPFGFSSFGSMGYQVLGAGDSPGAVTVNSGGGSWFHGRALSVAIPNLGTAPVHTGYQSGSGSVAVLDGTPTPGNILVACGVTEGSGRVIIGWTEIAGELIYNGTGSAMAYQVYMRCVEEGDTDEIDVMDAAFSHWTFVTEWPA